MALISSAERVNRMPKSIQALPDSWQEMYMRFKPLAGYDAMVELGWFKSHKSASTVINSDPDAPVAQYVGRAALFDRQALILWAYRRANKRCRRGRRPAAR